MFAVQPSVLRWRSTIAVAGARWFGACGTTVGSKLPAWRAAPSFR